jgi:uncharacterized membrane protein
MNLLRDRRLEEMARHRAEILDARLRRIVPPYIPWPRVVVLLSGALELLGAAGLLVQPIRRAAGLGLFALTIAVTPAHFYMLQRRDLFAVPYWALVLRLPLQAALLTLIWWSTISRTSLKSNASSGAGI